METITTQELSDKAEVRRAYHRRYYKDNKYKIRGQQKQGRLADPAKAKIADRKAQLKMKYNLTIEQFDELLFSQGGVCKICGTDTPGGRHGVYAVDHCHTTNVVRGILCHQCNIMLGNAKDNPDILSSAISYLKDFEARQYVN